LGGPLTRNIKIRVSKTGNSGTLAILTSVGDFQSRRTIQKQADSGPSQVLSLVRDYLLRRVWVWYATDRAADYLLDL